LFLYTDSAKDAEVPGCTLAGIKKKRIGFRKKGENDEWRNF
jgi:hypothetical protein